MSYPTSIRVRRFIIHETGTYNPQYRRPYVSDLSVGAMNQIIENAAQANKITPAIFSGFAGQVITPSASPESMITITDGWENQRLRFMLELEVQYKTGASVIEVVTGYSANALDDSVSLYGSLNPNTNFIINNTVILREQYTPTSFGATNSVSIVDTSHVLADNNWQGVHSKNLTHGLRPTDVFNSMMVKNVSAELAADGSYNGSTVVPSIPVKSNRNNAISTDYLTKILNSYKLANVEYRGFEHDAMAQRDTLSAAQNYCKENSSSRDPFLDVIASFTSNTVKNSFTMAELSRLDPNTDSVTKYVKLGVTEKRTVHTAGQTSNWAAQDIHTYFATILSNSVPAAMMSNFITRVQFISTNASLGGVIDTRIAAVKGFVNNMDMTPYIQHFIHKIETEVLSEFKQYQSTFVITMSVDLLGETYIKIVFNNETYEYVTPSFCDALLVPVVTQRNDVVSSLTDKMSMLLENVTQVTSSQQPQSPSLIDFNPTFSHL